VPSGVGTTLPDLPYDYDALSPVISPEIMTLHHSKHHQTYVTNFNAALSQYEEAMSKEDWTTMLSLQPSLKFNGGGHLNHSLFWTTLAPVGSGGKPEGQLLKQLERQFGSVENFKQQFNAKTAAVQGSGWGWLGYDVSDQRLVISTTANQDPLQSTTGLIPLLGVDVWEHAYYLDYKNVRPDYLTAIWQVMNWHKVAERFNQATTSSS